MASPGGSSGYGSPKAAETYSTYLPHCVRFFYATRIVLRKHSVQASHPLQTALEQYRVAVTAPHVDSTGSGIDDWEKLVQDSGDRLETLLHDANLHDPIAVLLPETATLQLTDGGGSMTQVIPNLWLGDSRVLLGDGPRALAQQNITHICWCCSQLQPRHGYTEMFKYSHIPVIDSDRANIARYFWKTNAFIEEGIDAGGGVLVLCESGISASAAVTVAYLMQTARLTTA